MATPIHLVIKTPSQTPAGFDRQGKPPNKKLACGTGLLAANRLEPPGRRPPQTKHATVFKTGIGCRPYLLKASSSQEIVMSPLRTTHPISRLAFAAAALAGSLWANAALASQGPGGGPGTASSFTQSAMAIIVYGTSALVIGAGLVRAMRRPR
jgi:hypothetical protein